MIRTALIMAGGRGERFWPLSRKSRPKQFLSLTNDGVTMIQHTIQRILPMVEAQNIYISTNQDYFELVREQLPEIPAENILCEPVSRNTAPCIGLAAACIQKKHGDAVMIVLPSDHLIKYNGMFEDTIKDACAIAEDGEKLLTVGIMPTYPETGYGYIKFNPKSTEEQSCRAYPVDCFVEKPNLETAKRYIADGQYLWNSGMFIWKVSTILSNFEKWLPDLYRGLISIQESMNTPIESDVLKQKFTAFKSISIDYGIMERASDIYILPGMFGWDDVGSWLSVERINQTNEYGSVVNGNVISVDTSNCIINAGGKLIAAVGLENIIVVDTADATLICDKDHTQEIKKVIENLKICNRNEYI